MPTITLSIELILSLVTALVIVVVWLVRQEGKIAALEARVTAQENRQSVLQEKHENLDSRIMIELTRIRESLARMEGRLVGIAESQA